MNWGLLGFIGLHKKGTVEEDKGTVTDICTSEGQSYRKRKLAYTA